MRPPTTPLGKVGLFGIGLAAYWPQFKGLKSRLQGYQRVVAGRLSEFCEVVDAGLVDSENKAAAAGDLFASHSVQLVICYVTTYATSSQVLPAVQRARAPVLILNLQPASALDYDKTDTGEWLANCCACCVPEIACAFARSRIDFHLVTGVLGIARGRFGESRPDHPDAVRAWREISDWVRAASAVSRWQRARIGFLGHTYPGMLDMYSDFTQHTAQLGVHIEVLELCDLEKRLPDARGRAVAAKRKEVRIHLRSWQRQSSGPPRASAAARAIGMGLPRGGGFGPARRRLRSSRNGLLLPGVGRQHRRTARGRPDPGLFVAHGARHSLQRRRRSQELPGDEGPGLLGCGGSYTEFYAMDFDEDFLLMGHDGPFHLGIAEGRPMLRGLGLYHGKRGFGVSVEARVKLGPVTLLAMTQTADGQLKLLAAEGESIPGPTLQIGNTNSRIRFAQGMREFVRGWCMAAPTHHCALGVGRVLPVIRNIASLCKLPYLEVS